MTHSIRRTSAIAIGMAALVSLSLSARADMSGAPSSGAPAPAANPAPASSAAPSLAEPAPTPSLTQSGPAAPRVAQHPAARRHARHYARHYGRRDYGANPVVAAATGVAGGVADLGSIAAYPFYCFPDYGACRVRVPYRF